MNRGSAFLLGLAVGLPLSLPGLGCVDRCEPSKLLVHLSYPDPETASSAKRIRFEVRRRGFSSTRCEDLISRSASNRAADVQLEIPVDPATAEGPFMVHHCGLGTNIHALADDDEMHPFSLEACALLDLELGDLEVSELNLSLQSIER